MFSDHVGIEFRSIILTICSVIVEKCPETDQAGHESMMKAADCHSVTGPGQLVGLHRTVYSDSTAVQSNSGSAYSMYAWLDLSWQAEGVLQSFDCPHLAFKLTGLAESYYFPTLSLSLSVRVCLGCNCPINISSIWKERVYKEGESVQDVVRQTATVSLT